MTILSGRLKRVSPPETISAVGSPLSHSSLVPVHTWAQSVMPMS
eukprot:CAMPEP_0185562852 /NCGR_PEP_ID=MMETSP1381-20130426/62277_1 /TAXON_ID=298111 /ORGANISM="Pavlova sp., Strain CCMP459" /LENGTH=43 /DNA_ID= /DNA_START= /DNA_END= /DNA_ORIENTATION=